VFLLARSAVAFSVSRTNAHGTSVPSTQLIDKNDIPCITNENESPSSFGRREALRGIIFGSGIASIITPNAAQAAALPLQTSSGTVRVEEIGGGLDLLSPNPLAQSSSDAFYPSSMTNTKWKIQRALTSVEGDLGQAGLAWTLLGGSNEQAFTSKLTEVYEATFIASLDTMKDANYEYDGKSLQYSILDRGYELSSRTGLATVEWDTNKVNSLDYTRNNDAVNLTVVKRKVEPPSENGFGSDEVYRIQSSAGGIFAGTNVYRAARVRRRYRRGFEEGTGKRILDCLEIVTTHRVLDGIAGMELPTSTFKSRLRYTQV